MATAACVCERKRSYQAKAFICSLERDYEATTSSSSNLEQHQQQQSLVNVVVRRVCTVSTRANPTTWWGIINPSVYVWWHYKEELEAATDVPWKVCCFAFPANSDWTVRKTDAGHDSLFPGQPYPANRTLEGVTGAGNPLQQARASPLFFLRTPSLDPTTLSFHSSCCYYYCCCCYDRPCVLSWSFGGLQRGERWMVVYPVWVEK